MKLIQKDIKRLVIYFFYDADGVVDRYVPFMLENIKKNCAEICVVCNGKLTPEGRNEFLKITPQLLVRENKGFDVWAYKAGLEYYGWDKLAMYDEIVLMNFTVYGPLYPFSEMFESMNQRDVDFWGITKHYKIEFDPFGTTGLGYVPEHIQSYFIAIRRPMVNSYEFRTYWDNMGEICDYRDAVGKHEAIFTKKFTDYGFTSDVYIQTDDLRSYTNYPLMFEASELIKNRRCPVFKKKAYTNEYYEMITTSAGEDPSIAYRYIRDHLDYDLDMFWENILRTNNMADIKDRLHLNYVLSRDHVMDTTIQRKLKTALVMHLYYEDLIDSSMEYAASMPLDADIYFTVCTPSMKLLVQEAGEKLPHRNVQIIQIENRGRDVSALLIGAANVVNDYDLVCFCHDKKTSQNEPYTVGQSFAYKCLENTIGSRAYVQNVIDIFEKEPRLGMVMPPPPNHADFYGGVGGEWGPNYQNVLELSKELNINVDIDCEKEPIAPLGTMFWFRPKALKPLMSRRWRYEDFPKEPNAYDGTILHAIERIYGFVAQSQGYYEAWVMSDQFAALELTNYHFMLRELTKAIHGRQGYVSNFIGTAQYLWSLEQAQSRISRKMKLKCKIKKVMPEPIWNACKKVYRQMGKKRLHE